MKPSTIAALVAGHAKAAVVVAAVTAASAGGGLAIANSVANSNSNLPSSDSVTVSSSTTPSPHAHGKPKSTDSNAATTPVNCPSGLANHGAFVSAIAKSTPAPSSSPDAHGRAVSEAAKSDCGKKDKSANGNDGNGNGNNKPHGKPSAHPTQANSHSTESHSPNPHSTESHSPNPHSTSHPDDGASPEPTDS
jgi:hypothetical protein